MFVPTDLRPPTPHRPYWLVPWDDDDEFKVFRSNISIKACAALNLLIYYIFKSNLILADWRYASQSLRTQQQESPWHHFCVRF